MWHVLFSNVTLLKLMVADTVLLKIIALSNKALNKSDLNHNSWHSE